MDDLLKIIAAAMEVEPPQDGKDRQWVELLPGPEIKLRDGRGPFTMMDANKVIQASDLERGIPVDFDHAAAKGLKGGDAPAAGWIVAMTAKNGGIEALVEWTSLGRERLKDRQYRYISPTFYATKDGHIIRIINAGLTNTPALTMKAVAASEQGEIDAVMEDDTSKPKAKASPTPTAFWKELTAALGMADTATRAEVMAEVVAIKKGRDAAKADLPTTGDKGEDGGKTMASLDVLASHIDTVNRERNDERMEMVITQASRDGRLPPALHGWARELCAAKPELFDQFVSGISPVTNFDALDPAHFTAVTAAKAPHSDAEDTLCTQLGVTRNDLR